LKKFLSILILFIYNGLLFSQLVDTTSIFDEEKKYPEDTLIIKNPSQAPKFTINKSKSDAFYDSLELKSKNSKFASQLHNLLVRNPYRIHPSNKDNDPVSYFKPFAGKFIRSIVIEQLDVFGPSVFDTTRKAQNWPEKLGNTLHISTRKAFIKSFLFISEQEKIDPYILADNERVLRTIPNIQDVRIYVVPVDGQPDWVDLKIVTKDVWAVGFAIETFDVDYGNFSIWNNNFLGFGQQIYFKTHYNLNEDPQYGYLAKYTIPNLGNTFTALSFEHEEKWDFDANNIKLDRKFITPTMKFGFGVSYEKKFEVKDYQTLDSTLYEITIDYEYFDTWAGYSFPLKSNQQELRRSIFVTTRRQSYNYFNPSISSNNYLYDFFTRQLYLTSLGITWQGYYSTRLFLGFGDTEDIPYGGMLKLTGGKEYNDFSSRLYFGATFAYSNYIKNFGFISNKFETGTFYQDNLEQGSIHYEGTYISPIFGTKRHFFRNIVRLDYLQGYNRFSDEFIELKNNEGIRGLIYPELIGNKRMFINNEIVYYSPHYLYGFRFVYFAFIDAGIINYKHNTLIKNPIHSSIGLGLRIRNERLVFNTIQVQFNFFPFESPIPIENKQFLEASGTPKIRMPEFAERAPEIVVF
jgi:hypothetical protein